MLLCQAKHNYRNLPRAYSNMQNTSLPPHSPGRNRQKPIDQPIYIARAPKKTRSDPSARRPKRPCARITLAGKPLDTAVAVRSTAGMTAPCSGDSSGIPFRKLSVLERPDGTFSSLQQVGGIHVLMGSAGQSKTERSLAKGENMTAHTRHWEIVSPWLVVPMLERSIVWRWAFPLVF
ncbi:hypothetical protein BDP81DRAFT_419495 [Colletotrichum phormii]|uniref:Uncharacterized protein n=1 Tax=Colletotrichum phormii TaxID=359342 RepID=A0AAI9ZYG3_9PEZI|nr:uncharacterized protein BDP81DRAFT_419495 [Colletotrichum phormii]KAK1640176.1 hypothetical protein BDP81DRAFT_419495 [Colletotrichum phormii]